MESEKRIEIHQPFTFPEIAIQIDFCPKTQRYIIFTLPLRKWVCKNTVWGHLGINWVLVELGLKTFAKSLFRDFQLYYQHAIILDNLGWKCSASFMRKLSSNSNRDWSYWSRRKKSFFFWEILKGQRYEDRESLFGGSWLRQVVNTKALRDYQYTRYWIGRLGNSNPKGEKLQFHLRFNDQQLIPIYKLKQEAWPEF